MRFGETPPPLGLPGGGRLWVFAMGLGLGFASHTLVYIRPGLVFSLLLKFIMSRLLGNVSSLAVSHLGSLFPILAF